MKYCISNIAWKPHEAEQVYGIMNERDITRLEVAPSLLTQTTDPYETTSEDRTRIKKELAHLGLQLTSMQSLLFGKPELTLFNEDTSRDALSQYLKKAIDFASDLGINNLVFGSPKNRVIPDHLDREKAYQIACDFFSSLAVYAQQRNVVLALEANPSRYNCNFATTTLEALEVIQRVNHPHFLLNYDIGTVIINDEDYRDFILNYNKYINHVHLAAPDLAPLPGSHQKLYHEVIALLKDIQYDKVVSIEMKAQSDSDNINQVITALGLFHD